MSGFEIAGIVLGAIPIIIGALEECKKVKNLERKCRKMGLFIDGMIEALDEQKLLIRSNLDILLRKSGACESSSESIPYRKILASKDVMDELKEYLGYLYDPFEKGVRRCEQSIWEVARSIKGLAGGLESLPQSLEELIDTASVGSSGKYNFKAKVRFGLRYEDAELKVKELEAATKRLDKVLQQGERLHGAELINNTSRSVSKFAKFLRQVRGHAIGLYPAIARAWSESCHAEHRTKLYLQSRPELLSNQRKAPLISFNLVFESKSDSAIGCLKHSINIEPLNDGEELEPLDRKLPSIRFRGIEDELNDNAPLSQVQSICESLRQARESQNLIKIYLCEQKLSKRIQSLASKNPRGNNGDEPAACMTSLADLLMSPNKSWKLRQRTTLAFSLASSLLQLHSTPWLADSWNKNSIFFPCSEDGDVMFDRPFIRNDFSESKKPHTPTEVGRRLNARRSLLELGITLIEIWQETTLELYSEQNGLDVDNRESTRLEVAKTWFDDAADQMVPNYVDAVERCVECCFKTNSTFPDWQDNMFQESVCDGIIKPLWDTCDYKRR